MLEVQGLVFLACRTENNRTLTDWTDNISPSPTAPESETSKMLCVSNASLIMQIQLSPNQVKQPFV